VALRKNTPTQDPKGVRMNLSQKIKRALSFPVGGILIASYAGILS